MDVPTYRHSHLMWLIAEMLKSNQCRQVSRIVPTVTGSSMIIHDDQKEVSYLIQISRLPDPPMKTEYSLTADEAIDKGGFADESLRPQFT